jgi:hypothetical protein
VLGVVASAFVAVTVLAHWTPSIWIPVGVLLAACLALFARYRGVRSWRADASLDHNSFADVVVRMRAKDRARELLDIKRREELLGAR